MSAPPGWTCQVCELTPTGTSRDRRHARRRCASGDHRGTPALVIPPAPRVPVRAR